MDLVSRRDFLAVTGVAAGTAKSYAQVAGANERLRIGVIGCGGMATHHMRSLLKLKEQQNIDLVAVCDIYQKRLDAAAQLTGGKPFKDYRKLLDEKEIDYVLIATPEHWHAKMAIDALDAGKHVYVEKPMTRYVEDAKKVVAKVKAKPNLKLQVGVQGMSDDSYLEANKLVKQGLLGKVVLAQIDYSRTSKDDYWVWPIDADAKPGVNLDWNAFLGPAKKRPWDPDRYFRWRRYWDYSGGIASDLFVHRVTRIIRSLDLTFPEFGAGAGGKFQFTASKSETPDTMNILLDYPGGPTVQLVSSLASDVKIEHLLRGHKATIEFTPSGFTLRPQKIYQNEIREMTYTKTGAEDIRLHHANLQAAIRKGEPLRCDAMLGYYGVVAFEMGVESLRRRKYMRWDKIKERIVPA